VQNWMASSNPIWNMLSSFTQYLQKALIVVFDVGSSNVACPWASLLVNDNGEISLCALFLTEYSGETCDDDVFLFVNDDADFVGEKTFWGFIFKFKSKLRKKMLCL